MTAIETGTGGAAGDAAESARSKAGLLDESRDGYGRSEGLTRISELGVELSGEVYSPGAVIYFSAFFPRTPPERQITLTSEPC